MRVKRGVPARDQHKKILKAAKGMQHAGPFRFLGRSPLVPVIPPPLPPKPAPPERPGPCMHRMHA